MLDTSLILIITFIIIYHTCLVKTFPTPRLQPAMFSYHLIFDFNLFISRFNFPVYSPSPVLPFYLIENPPLSTEDADETRTSTFLRDREIIDLFTLKKWIRLIRPHLFLDL